MRQEHEEAVDTAVMARSQRPAWDAQKHDAAHVAVALSLGHDKAVLDTVEIKEMHESSTEARYIQAWQCLGRGDVDKALSLADGLLLVDKTAEKVYYTRAVCHARKANWRFAMADYSM